MTTIQQTGITDENGNPAKGEIVIEWHEPDDAPEGTPRRWSIEVAAGTAALIIEPGTYEATWMLTCGAPWTELWTIPPSADVLTFSDIKAPGAHLPVS